MPPSKINSILSPLRWLIAYASWKKNQEERNAVKIEIKMFDGKLLIVLRNVYGKKSLIILICRSALISKKAARCDYKFNDCLLCRGKLSWLATVLRVRIYWFDSALTHLTISRTKAKVKLAKSWAIRNEFLTYPQCDISVIIFWYLRDTQLTIYHPP